METFIGGAVVMACAAIGLVFLRFWKSSRDPLFACFAASFWIQGAQWLYTSLGEVANEQSPYHYLPRLAAYGLIGYAIVRKNARRAGTPP
jgi:hypothetical protein